MAILTNIFPSSLSYGSTTIPTYSTRIIGSKTGWEGRNANWESSRARFDAAMLVKTQAQLDVLNNFFHAMKAMAHPFQFKDWGDYKSCGVDDDIASDDITIVASASSDDIGETNFAIFKTYTDGSLTTTRDITQPIASSVLVEKNGSPLANPADFSINSDGEIVLVVALIALDTLKCGFEFNLACRFNTDELMTNLESYRVGSANAPIIEIRI